MSLSQLIKVTINNYRSLWGLLTYDVWYLLMYCIWLLSYLVHLIIGYWWHWLSLSMVYHHNGIVHHSFFILFSFILIKLPLEKRDAWASLIVFRLLNHPVFSIHLAFPKTVSQDTFGNLPLNMQYLCDSRDKSLKIKTRFDLTGRDSWFMKRFWIFMTEFFVIMNFFMTR